MAKKSSLSVQKTEQDNTPAPSDEQGEKLSAQLFVKLYEPPSRGRKAKYYADLAIEAAKEFMKQISHR